MEDNGNGRSVLFYYSVRSLEMRVMVSFSSILSSKEVSSERAFQPFSAGSTAVNSE